MAEAPRSGPAGPLDVRAFRWLFSTALISNLGVWIWSVMGGYVMAQLTHVPSLVAAFPVALALPGVAVVIFRHRENIDRLIRGVEPAVGDAETPPAP